jgi:hypothetical protein
MTEHIRNIRLAWVGFGWFIAAALTGLFLVVLSALDLVRAGAPVEGAWVAIALAVAFLFSGFYVGTRIAAAPVLNGVAMALVSVVVWLALNLLLGEPTGVTAWDTLPGGTALTLLALQAVAAVLGARAGVRWTRR